VILARQHNGGMPPLSAQIILAPNARKRVKHLYSRPAKILVVACDYGETVPSCCRSDETIFDRHSLAAKFEFEFLFGPNMRNTHIKTDDSSLQRIDKVPNPFLERCARPPLLGPDPISELPDDDCAGVTVCFVFF